MKINARFFLVLSAVFSFVACSSCKDGGIGFGKKKSAASVSLSEQAETLDYIFDNQTLGSTVVTIKRSEWDRLCDYYRFYYKNETCVHAESYSYEKRGKSWLIENVGFRLRGNTSRYCPQGVDNGREQGQMSAEWNPGYYDYASRPNSDYRQTHFKVDFEEFLQDGGEQRLAGCLKGMALKRLDDGCGREIFCYDFFHKNGIWTAPRACHTRLFIDIIEDKGDGSTTRIDYGVYEMFEEVNSQSLKARTEKSISADNAWKNAKGNLWKCMSDLTDGSRNDIGVEEHELILDEDRNPVGKIESSFGLDLKTNKKNLWKAKEELRGFIRDLNALRIPSGEDDKKSISEIKKFYEKWFDVDFFLRTYAVSLICGMDDDYWGNSNNYYLYFDTASEDSSGKVYYIPFDYDNTLGCSISEGGFKHNPMDWGRGKNRPLMDKLLAVPEYKAKFAKYLMDFSAEDSYWNFGRCSRQFRSWVRMIGPYLKSKDLSYRGVGVSEFRDHTWQPGGYFLTEEPNVFDATRDYITRWLTGGIKFLTISAQDDYDGGIKISMENIPTAAAVRRVFINGKLACELGLIWENDVGRISEHISDPEWVYPYTEAGKTYEVRVAYLDRKYNVLESSNVLVVKAKGGEGEFCLLNEPSYTIEKNVLKFNPEPVLKIGSEKASEKDNWDKYYVLELTTLEWEYQGWNYLGHSCNNFDFSAHTARDLSPDKTLMFDLYYVVSNSTYGNYRLVIYEQNETHFKLTD